VIAFQSGIQTNVLSYFLNKKSEHYFLWFEAPIHGFGLWFEVEFNGPAVSSQNLSSNSNPIDIIQKKRTRRSDNTVVLSTAPEDEPTHWHQVLLSENWHFPQCIILLVQLFMLLLMQYVFFHLLQTIFYFSDPIEVTQDQIIEGSVIISPSEENPRCLNIHLECS
jgi:protein arginine N-methyltransferase 6